MANRGSSACSCGVDGGPGVSEPGNGDRDCRSGDAAPADKPEARRVELPDAEEVVESSGNSTTSHVCSVASGANDTLRLAATH